MTKTGLGASYRFHISSSTRVTLGLVTFQLVLLLILVALQPPAARELLLKGLAALLTSAQPMTALVLGLASPLVLEASARREQSLKVGLYLERRFDCAREAET